MNESEQQKENPFDSLDVATTLDALNTKIASEMKNSGNPWISCFAARCQALDYVLRKFFNLDANKEVKKQIDSLINDT